jgi:O-antigen/teichoic acid export membrane protein
MDRRSAPARGSVGPIASATIRRSGADDPPDLPVLTVSASDGLAPVPVAVPTAGWRGRLAGSPTVAAAGLAAATMAANVIAVVFTVVFTRVLGTSGYGSLAALLNVSVILFVPGAALQVAAAREGTLGRLGVGGELSATLRRWTLRLLAALALVAVVAAVAREPLAAALGVEQEWAAAAVPLTAGMWLLLSLQRGLLQAARAYRVVGLSVVLEATGRLAAALALVGLGAGVTGAYLGTLASFVVAAVVLGTLLRRRLGSPAAARVHRLRALARDAAVPIAGLVVVAALQNVDVILARHVLSDDDAGVYAASTVAAKALVWIATGIGLWLLPEAVRRLSEQRDPRPVLGRAFAVILAIAAPALLVYALVPRAVLGTAFGSEYESGDSILLILGIAYALLALTYLAVQFLLGMRRHGPLPALAVAALAQPAILAGMDGLESFAVAVLAVQAAAAAVAVGAAFSPRVAARRRPRSRPPAAPPAG